MASSGRPAYHQDYIARIRHSNTLPPPPCPPKLLDIPNTGLAQYTSPGFASRLAREQPLNIEGDAELGMPIDLVGIPGVFNGIEDNISAMDDPPPIHPRDRPLMRGPNALGKPTSNVSGVSFLRRTEYITSVAAGKSQFESSSSGNTIRNRGKRRRMDLTQDDPTNIMKHIQKGFDLAYPQEAYKGAESGGRIRAAETTPQERQAWKQPKHPSKPDLTLVDTYPLLPDWDSLTDNGAYIMFKFVKPPAGDATRYEPKLDVALLRPAGTTMEDWERYQAELERHAEDPTLPQPIERYQWEYYLPADDSVATVQGIKRNFSTMDPDNEEDISFDTAPGDAEGRKCFKYKHVRKYQTVGQTADPTDPYGEFVAMALHDPEKHDADPLRPHRLQKGAYFYPIMQRTSLRPRPKDEKIPMYVKEGEEEPPQVDFIDVIGVDPQDEGGRAEKRKQYDADVVYE